MWLRLTLLTMIFCIFPSLISLCIFFGCTSYISKFHYNVSISVIADLTSSEKSISGWTCFLSGSKPSMSTNRGEAKKSAETVWFVNRKPEINHTWLNQAKLTVPSLRLQTVGGLEVLYVWITHLTENLYFCGICAFCKNYYFVNLPHT